MLMGLGETRESNKEDISSIKEGSKMIVQACLCNAKVQRSAEKQIPPFPIWKIVFLNVAENQFKISAFHMEERCSK